MKFDKGESGGYLMRSSSHRSHEVIKGHMAVNFPETFSRSSQHPASQYTVEFRVASWSETCRSEKSKSLRPDGGSDPAAHILDAVRVVAQNEPGCDSTGELS